MNFGDGLVVHFVVANGIYEYHQSTGWTRATTNYPISMVPADLDLNGSLELVCIYPNGLFVWDGNSWTRLTTSLAQEVVSYSNDNSIKIENIIIQGPQSIDESIASTKYTCKANYSDGTSKTITEALTWTVNCPAATISSGVLTTLDIDEDTFCKINAVYTSEGNTWNANLDIKINNANNRWGVKNITIQGPQSVHGEHSILVGYLTTV